MKIKKCKILAKCFVWVVRNKKYFPFNSYRVLLSAIEYLYFLYRWSCKCAVLYKKLKKSMEEPVEEEEKSSERVDKRAFHFIKDKVPIKKIWRKDEY